METYIRLKVNGNWKLERGFCQAAVKCLITDLVLKTGHGIIGSV